MRAGRAGQLALWVLVFAAAAVWAEKPSDLPVPTAYVNDYAHVLSADGAQKIEALCMQVQQQADAQLFVVTIKTLDDGMTKEEFTDQLEEKWKAGKKGQDRAAIMLLVLQPRGTRIETGYGLEGMLNDAKVGAILDQADAQIKTGDYDDGLYTAIDGMAVVIAADRGVTLTEPVPVHHYHYAQDQQRVPQRLGLGQIVLGVGFVILILILIRTGHIGWAIWLVLNLMGGGGGGGRGGNDDDRGGGGFGGIGGGSSGGGGASRDF